MAWIEFHEALWDHWKVSRLSDALHVDYAHAVGTLACLWVWAAQHARDGNVSRFSDRELLRAARFDRKIPPDEFVTILTTVGWLNADRTIHDWQQYGVRLLEGLKRRVASFRQAEKSKERRGEERKRKEKKRKEKKHVTVPIQKRYSNVTHSATTFERFWVLCPKKVGKLSTQKCWSKIDPALHETIMAAMARQRTWPQWTKDGGQFIPHPTTWLNGRRWEDEAPSPLAAPLATTHKGLQNLARLDAKMQAAVRTSPETTTYDVAPIP